LASSFRCSVGVKAFGIIGLFTGPIIVSVAMALLKILEEERIDWDCRSVRENQRIEGQSLIAVS
jgi:predicted PurR-regulated permease PerM